MGTIPGEPYFDHSSKKGKERWDRIKERFKGKYAYCRRGGIKLEMQHLVMFNREQGGLHHPGNVVPACSKCNTRRKNQCGEYLDWVDHLAEVTKSNRGINVNFDKAKRDIEKHMKCEDFPDIAKKQEKIECHARSLYKKVRKLQEEYENKAKKLAEDINSSQT